MLKLIQNEQTGRSPAFSKGFREGLHRIAGLTATERSKDEWLALLVILRWVVKDLEAKVKSFDKKKPELKVIK